MGYRDAGVVVSFHSCVGNIGRSMGLAHVAWLLANAGHRVLVLDWAIESQIAERPQVDRYFAPWMDEHSATEKPGLVDWLWDYTQRKHTQGGAAPREGLLDRHTSRIEYRFPHGGWLDIIATGRRDRRYQYRVRYLSWRYLCDVLDGVRLLDEQFGALRKSYDYVFVDLVRGPRPRNEVAYALNRVSDMVMLFYTHRPGVLEATEEVARSVLGTGRQTDCLPIATRVELAEMDAYRKAQRLAKARLGPYVKPEAPEWPDAFTAAYVPYLEVGPVGLRFDYDSAGIWHRVASRLSSRPIPEITADEGERLDAAARKFDSSDERVTIYNPGAPPEPYEGSYGYAFISYARADLDHLLVIAENLEFLGVSVWWDAAIPGATAWEDELALRVQHCDFFVLLASSRSMSSKHVHGELREAVANRKPILTLRLDDTPAGADLAAPLDRSQMLNVWHPDFDRDLARTVRHLQSPPG